MATLDDVRALALALPEAVESTSYGSVAWKVRGKTFVWERPLRQRDVADLEALGERVPEGELAGVRVPAADKEAVLATVPAAFDIPHFRGFPAVLVELDRVDLDELRELITDGWVMQAPKRLAREYLDSL
ncbi:MmcQ/YjbR family DNA-binding protein [Nocardioides sp.]|jgi:hypothetical protein|uniref:MmcQ/YjbR family DNA-binding protein n=1 Tax=Nocardioides sp. TaxID=35761 RepID=UPI002B694BF8|nr:MmcQ/YjbR family DNA-binding protein [Nocardioides sp.]HVX55222.1 MmcQ/YjbR family DNA-binding protein [Nocardioides sp.]